MPLRISIAGDIGSGKTTVAKRLAGMMGSEPLSIGSVQRQLALEKGITTLELNQLAEHDEDVDREIDRYFEGLATGDLVAEARLAWHFVPNTLKVYLYISDYEAVRRIVDARRSDEIYDEDVAVNRIFARRKSEVERFKRYYGVDIDDLSNYDLVIDTTFASIDEVVRKTHKYAQSRKTPSARYLCPRNLVPTQNFRDVEADRVTRIENDIIANGYNVLEPISVLYVDHVFHIVDGHARVAAAIRNKLTFVPAAVVGHDDDEYRPGLTAWEYVRAAVTDRCVHDWEDAIGFHFQDPIWRGRAHEAHKHGKAEIRARG